MSLPFHPGYRAGYYDAKEVLSADLVLSRDQTPLTVRGDTNKFAGSVKRTEPEWAKIQESIKSYVIRCAQP